MTEDPIITGALFVGYATAYMVAMYAKNVWQDPDVKFDPVYGGTTVLLGVVAGLIMAWQGDAMSAEALAGATAIAIPIVDQFLNVFLDGADVEAPPIE